MDFDFSSYADIAFRSSAVYIFMIVAFRLFGKRELSQLSIGDLVLIVLISNAVQNAMVGENTTLSGGITAAFVLFALNAIFSFLVYKFKGFRSFVQTAPIQLIYNGKINTKNLENVLMSEDELMEALREHGVNDVHNVSLAMLETDGNISVIAGKDDSLKKGYYKRRRERKNLQDL